MQIYLRIIRFFRQCFHFKSEANSFRSRYLGKKISFHFRYKKKKKIFSRISLICKDMILDSCQNKDKKKCQERGSIQHKLSNHSIREPSIIDSFIYLWIRSSTFFHSTIAQKQHLRIEHSRITLGKSTEWTLASLLQLTRKTTYQ